MVCSSVQNQNQLKPSSFVRMVLDESPALLTSSFLPSEMRTQLCTHLVLRGPARQGMYRGASLFSQLYRTACNINMKSAAWGFLVAQWQRVRLPMQETRLNLSDPGRSHIPRSIEVSAPQLLSLGTTAPEAHAASARAPQQGEAARSKKPAHHTPEKKHTQHQRPNMAQNKSIIKLFIKKRCLGHRKCA